MNFIKVDRFKDEATGKMAKSYGQMICIDDFNDVGWSDKQIYSLLIDNTIKKLKLENIKQRECVIVHKWAPWFKWVQMVDVKKAAHLAADNREINGWIWVQWMYYICNSQYK